MRTVFAFTLTIGLVATSPPAKAVELDPTTKKALSTARQGVARVYCVDGGFTFPASGFVVKRPKDNAKVIITAAHIVPSGNPLSATLYATLYSGVNVNCEPIAYSADCDLMALWPLDPIDAPALSILSDSDPQPNWLDHVWLFGSARGTGISTNPGTLNAAAESAAVILRDLFGRGFQHKLNVRHDTTMIRHNAPSGKGFSGGPVIDRLGRVLGIQQSALTNAQSECFAIHARYIATLELDSSPELFKRRHPEFVANVRNPRNDTLLGDAVMLQVGDQRINAQCSRDDSVPLDPDVILNRYIQDSDSFRKRFIVTDMRSFLKDMRLTQIRNDAMGFSFLVPHGYLVVTTETERPGIVVAVAKLQDDSISLRDQRVTLRAFSTDDYTAAARRTVDRYVAADKYASLGDKKDDEVAQYTFVSQYVKNEIIDRVLEDFREDVLQLHSTDGAALLSGDTKRPLFRQEDVQHQPSINGTAWATVHYLSQSDDIGHTVQCGLLENVAVLVHCRFKKQDHDYSHQGKPVSRDFLEQLFIRSTVSLY